MKKIFTLTLLAGFLASFSAFADTYKFPGYDCTDKAAIAKQVPLAKSLNDQIHILAIQKLVNNPPTTYADICKAVDEVVDIVCPTPEVKSYYSTRFKKQIVFCTKAYFKFKKDAFEFCKSNPCSYDAYYFRSYTELSDTVRYRGLIACLLKYDTVYGARDVTKFLQETIAIAINLTDVDVKGDLIKLNRKYSLKLIKDKETWTPVVQMIRTALSTY